VNRDVSISFLIWERSVVSTLGESRSDLNIITDLTKRLTPNRIHYYKNTKKRRVSDEEYCNCSNT
jgi:anaerobic selenocysteine-containing dehydrogenase